MIERLGYLIPLNTVHAGFSPHRIPRPGSQISTAAEPWQYNLYEAHGPCTKFSEPRTKTTRHDTKKPLSGSGKIRWRHSGGNLAAQNQPARSRQRTTNFFTLRLRVLKKWFVVLWLTYSDRAHLNHGLSEGCRSSRSMLASRPELWDLQVGAHHLGPLH